MKTILITWLKTLYLSVYYYPYQAPSVSIIFFFLTYSAVGRRYLASRLYHMALACEMGMDGWRLHLLWAGFRAIQQGPIVEAQIVFVLVAWDFKGPKIGLGRSCFFFRYFVHFFPSTHKSFMYHLFVYPLLLSVLLRAFQSRNVYF